MAYRLPRSRKTRGPRRRPESGAGGRVGRVPLLAGLALLALTAASPASTQPPVPTEEAGATPSPEAPPGHRDVREIRRLKTGGGHLDWSAQGDRIAFDQAGPDGRRDVWLMDPDGGGELCLTCEVYDLRKLSSFNPTWHPSGRFLVFQVQDIPKRLDMTPLELATPLRAAHGELWMIPREGRRPWQLTRVGERGGGVMDPHFSHEADRLVWSERLRSSGGPWGEWALRVAELKIGRGVPHLGKVKTFRPQERPGLVIAQELTPDDRGVLVVAGEGGDLFRFDFAAGQRRPVGPSPGARGALARYIPGRDGIVWATDLGLPRRDSWQKLPRRDDLWIESPRDGRGGRLTFFNDPASDHFLGEAMIDDLAWSPGGDRFVAYVVSAGKEGIREDIYLVVLDPSYRR